MCSRTKRRHEQRRKVAIMKDVGRLSELSTRLQVETVKLSAGVFSYKSDGDVIEMLNDIDYELSELSNVILSLYDSLEGR